MSLLRTTGEALLVVLPLMATTLQWEFMARSHDVAFDFHWAYYPAVTRLLSGGNPYAATHYQLMHGMAFVYPALSALVLVPFGLFSRATADCLYVAFCMLLVPATLWTLRVRDWRIYAVAFAWLPVMVGWDTGNVSLPLAFVAALTWRHRDRPLVAGLLAVAAVSIKPFVWPLCLWLLATRRFRAAAWALVWGLLLNLVAWWIVGFDQVPSFLRLAGIDTGNFSQAGYGVIAMAHYLGFSHEVGELLMLASAAAFSLGVIYQGWRRHGASAFIIAVALMLIASPLVWSHYFVFLLLPLALRRTRFHWLWLAPIAMWVCPPSTATVGWQAGVAWLVAATCFIGATLGLPGPRRPPDPRKETSQPVRPGGPDVRLTHGLDSTAPRADPSVARRFAARFVPSSRPPADYYYE